MRDNSREETMKTSVLFFLCLLAFPGFSQGRVVRVDEAGFAECNGFFYGETPPEGFTEPFHVKICQRYNKEPRFATLYSTEDKTPLYSAFKYTKPAQSREESWLVEPQIDDAESDLDEMKHEADIGGSVNKLGANQALSSDYADSGYERGQLNPSSLNEDDFQIATYTLTNAVPMTPAASKNWHRDVKTIIEQALAPHCENKDSLYLIAGSVPSKVRVKDKMSVPQLLWLAACCSAPEMWSVGLVRQMSDESHMEELAIGELEKQFPTEVNLFMSNCGEGKQSQGKMEAVLQTINQLQSTEPILPTVTTFGYSASTPGPDQTAEEERGEGSLLKRVAGLIALPFTKLLRIVFSIVREVVRYTFYFLWYVVKQFSNIIVGGFSSLWNGAMAYVKEISLVLLNIPRDMGQVAANIIKGFAQIVYHIVSLTCRILSIPVRLFLHIASFPYYTLGAIPVVIKDIAVGIGSTFSLIIDATAALLSGSTSLATHIVKRIIPKVSSDD
ncbi:PREDICTED: endonuclease domain-containing 1 protein [Crocodylus porosus]|uniref:Endonuclease domain containing 1 n=1 Tax=Crocodylus porosus TaxID=8502 RepID=A0A7M4FCZ5_CROPO|nr:PREDICTED: endonuclease domain-containing 1 protein [Crocodylus porosus]